MGADEIRAADWLQVKPGEVMVIGWTLPVADDGTVKGGFAGKSQCRDDRWWAACKRKRLGTRRSRAELSLWGQMEC